MSRLEYVIFDRVDRDYHYGDGEWGHDRSKAFIYTSERDAEAGLDDVDCEELLRDRLEIVCIGEAPVPEVVALHRNRHGKAMAPNEHDFSGTDDQCIRCGQLADESIPRPCADNIGDAIRNLEQAKISLSFLKTGFQAPSAYNVEARIDDALRLLHKERE